jgi:hypothetical protein
MFPFTKGVAMTYETPEVFELGNAEELTLGSCGGPMDWCGFNIWDVQGCEPPCGVHEEPKQEE